MRFIKMYGSILAVLSVSIGAVVGSDQYSSSSNGDACGYPNCRPEPQIPAIRPSPGGNWLGFGADVYNNHWAGSDALVDIASVKTLTTVCQKKYEPGLSAAPLIENGVAYYNTFGGLLVALDYETCQEHWTLNVTELILKVKGNSDQVVATGGALASRSTPVSDGDVLYFGTLARAMAVAVDKKSGKVIDTLEIGNHPLAILTQSPTVYNHRVFFGVSTTESGGPAVDPSYKLSHHGSMNAVELRHGRLALVWTTHMIPPGANFSGASVWGSQPSIDPIRNQVFIGTGQLFSLPDEFVECQDANSKLRVQTEHLANEPCLPRNVYQTSVLALDIDSGEINWYRTLGALDAWNAACVPQYFGGAPGDAPGPNCPPNIGNDTDFGMAPTFVLGSEYTPRQKDIIVAGQKNGNLYAFSAQTGSVMWAVQAAPGGLEGGLSWGVAVDQDTVYYTGINTNRVNFTLFPSNETVSNSIFGAVNLRDGSPKWQIAVPRNETSLVIPVVVNDVVLTGTTGRWEESSLSPVGPGSFIALNKFTGEILRDDSLDAFFHAGIAVVNEYVMFGTGYGGLEAAQNGSFHVMKIGSTPPASGGDAGDSDGNDAEFERKKAELAKGKAELRKKIEELEKEADELDRLRDEL
jgi:outer membrane protein assembly factor BamB